MFDVPLHCALGGGGEYRNNRRKKLLKTPAVKSLYRSIFSYDDLLLWCLHSFLVHGSNPWILALMESSALHITEVLPETCLSHTWTIFNGTGRWRPER